MTLGYYIEKLDYERNRLRRIKKEERGPLKKYKKATRVHLCGLDM